MARRRKQARGRGLENGGGRTDKGEGRWQVAKEYTSKSWTEKQVQNCTLTVGHIRERFIVWLSHNNAAFPSLAWQSFGLPHASTSQEALTSFTFQKTGRWMGVYMLQSLVLKIYISHQLLTGRGASRSNSIMHWPFMWRWSCLVKQPYRSWCTLVGEYLWKGGRPVVRDTVNATWRYVWMYCRTSKRRHSYMMKAVTRI